MLEVYERNNKLTEYALSAKPSWDGMAAVNGSLYIALENGKVVCFRTVSLENVALDYTARDGTVVCFDHE